MLASVVVINGIYVLCILQGLISETIAIIVLVVLMLDSIILAVTGKGNGGNKAAGEEENEGGETERCVELWKKTTADLVNNRAKNHHLICAK